MILAIIVSILFACLITLVKRQYSFWENLGIPYIKPTFPFGSFKAVVTNKKSYGTAVYELYKQTNEPLMGIYTIFKPVLLIRDKELVKTVLTNDFEHFHNRGAYCNAKTDPISANLFTLPGKSWKPLRNKITPAFTSGKLKGMFSHVKHVGDELVAHMNPLAEKGETIDIFNFTHRFVVDCLASVAFGQEGVSTINEPDHDFITIPKISNNGWLSALRNAGLFAFPETMKVIGLKSQSRPVREFFINMVAKTIKEREENNIVRKDLMQYLIQLRNSGNFKSDDDDDWNIQQSDKTLKTMSCEEIASEVFVFYIAGNDSSSATIGFILFELTRNQNFMKRAQDDIKSTLEKHGGEFTYESVMDMKFIDLCVKESLRKYPILPMLNRECTKDYQIPGTKFTIEKGTAVIVSVMGMHRDEDFFPNADSFDPDRFSDERHDYDENVYMPFGVGPRNCLAFRMGLLFVKVGLVLLLKNFNFEGLRKEELKYNTASVALLPQHGQGMMKLLKK